MIGCLAKIDNRLYERYVTLERNLKSGSNSFFDAYLDMLEEFVKLVVAEYGVDTGKKRTAGELLRLDAVQTVFTDKVGLDANDYRKIQNYILKINKHKHENEKKIYSDVVILYMRLFYNLIFAYANSHGMNISEFDSKRYVSLLNSYHKENKRLRMQLNSTTKDLVRAVQDGKEKQSDIEEYNELLSESRGTVSALEEDNERLSRRIDDVKYRLDEIIAPYENRVKLKNFVLNSTKDYGWAGEKKVFVFCKVFNIVLPVLLVVLAVLSSVMSMVGWREYHPVLHVPTVAAVIILVLTVLKISKTDFVLDEDGLVKNSVFRYDKINILNRSEVKTVINAPYVCFIIISAVWMLSNLITGEVKSVEIFRAAWIMDIVSLVTASVSIGSLRWFYKRYQVVRMTNVTEPFGDNKTIIYDMQLDLFCTLEQYEVMYPKRNYPPVKRG